MVESHHAIALAGYVLAVLRILLVASLIGVALMLIGSSGRRAD